MTAIAFPPRGEGVLPYKGLMGTCGQPGYVFRDFCLEQGIEFIIFCLNQDIDLSIFVLKWVKYLKQEYQKSEFCLKMGRKISDICLKQGQGMRGRAAPPQPGIHRVPPPPGLSPQNLFCFIFLARYVGHLFPSSYFPQRPLSFQTFIHAN